MYRNNGNPLGEPPSSINTLRMRKNDDVCPPGYSPDEKAKAQTTGLINPDVSLSGGRLLIADFPINKATIRSTTLQEKLLQDTLAAFERDKDLHFRIVGFTDCLGQEQYNQKLRKERALAALQRLSPGARSRVVSAGAGHPGTFVPGSDNSTQEGRARNRSVVIEFWRDTQPAPSRIDITKPPQRITNIIEHEQEGPMEQEKRKRAEANKKYTLPPSEKQKSASDKIRQKLRDEGVPDLVIDQFFHIAASAGRAAAEGFVNQMSISDTAKTFVKYWLKDIFSWKF